MKWPKKAEKNDIIYWSNFRFLKQVINVRLTHRGRIFFEDFIF